MLPKNHPEVQQLFTQLQAQYENIGRVPSVVGVLNIDQLRTELCIRGWNTSLAEDGRTVLLEPRDTNFDGGKHDGTGQSSNSPT